MQTLKESIPKLVRQNIGSILVSAHADPDFIQEYTAAVIREVIRMFPPAPRLAKHVTTDTFVKTKIFDSHSLEVLRELDVPIKAGSDVVLDILGLHMNRKLFTNFLIDFFLPASSFSTKRSLGETMSKFLNQRGSSMPTVIAGLAKHVRGVTCSNSAFSFN